MLLRKLIVTATVTVLGMTGQLLQAENAPVQEKLSVIDGYYPAYPPTAPATGEQQTLIQKGEYLAKMGIAFPAILMLKEVPRLMLEGCL